MQFPPNHSDDEKKPGGQPSEPSPPNWQRWVGPALLIVLALWLLLTLPNMLTRFTGGEPTVVPYSFFVEQVIADNVSSVTFAEVTLRGEFRQAVTPPDSGGVSVRDFSVTLLPVQDSELVELLRTHNVTIEAQIVDTSPLLLLLINLAPFVLIVAFFIWSTRRAQRQMTGVFGFGQSRAREYTVEKPQVTFADVAGQDAAKTELVEIVDFLKEPEKYIALGARIPRGVLLVGPPGTGKTLMARAVAGEAHVAFFSIAASEFVEMFVGVGASRVRDLFRRAKEAAPSIVFVDEIDAVGRMRGAGLGGGNDEREQTLNQLLAEMDGFDQTESVIVMAATNRPDVLDTALLRPGRFDRQVTLGSPDRKGRLDILKIHTRGKPLAEDVNLDELARTTIGFSGADLANLANEAALTAARKNHKRINARDFSDAFDRIILGTERPPLTDESERRVAAYHEAGHALVATYLPNADPINKITIVPRGQALGVAISMPEDDKYMRSREYWMATMAMALGGRAAEEIAIGSITTGAESDLRRVTAIARRMVANWGMSGDFGLLNFGDDERQPFLGYSLSQGRIYSEETASVIDNEVRRLVEEAHQEARAILLKHRSQLDALAQELLTNEVVNRERLLAIAGVEEDTVPPAIANA
ncbi:MAG: ATP-dependent metallopeptidase FtsH/Yme1/Tma family protein [Chloroflexi bacterium]|nr:ATP-dependent metallopeptidase FtsH/Yme1/Tma family protein [Chloroflexota bacterium]